MIQASQMSESLGKVDSSSKGLEGSHEKDWLVNRDPYISLV